MGRGLQVLSFLSALAGARAAAGLVLDEHSTTRVARNLTMSSPDPLQLLVQACFFKGPCIMQSASILSILKKALRAPRRPRHQENIHFVQKSIY